ncbi:nicotinate-nucleotide--dimethylbenzimidazole phosphoribosyltransferase [Prolixibacteraceae bacterium JC049]|nr:nicotinate-nucleotide--dimethylbenzimidazole phosphoribosyltransferase [Prolixibacteraceae bacterium JC049]
MKFTIQPLSNALNDALKYKIDQKTKPLGSLGQLERIAYQIGRIQNNLTPRLENPAVVVVGADHGICAEGVSPCPTEVTWQQMYNFAADGGGISLFAKHAGMKTVVVDAGVDHDFPADSGIVDCKVRKGTRNFLKEPAMTLAECEKAMANGAEIVTQLHENGTNVVAFGEMGIGNTSPASVLMSLICGMPMETCVGPGSGLDDEGVRNKCRVLSEAVANHGKLENPLEILATYGGLEIATIVGGMLKAAELKMLILNDGFIITSALLVAQAMHKEVLDYTIFSHKSKEGGHTLMVEYMNGEPVLDLDLRLGEGTGAALAYPVVTAAVEMLNNMTSFEEASITDTTDNGIRVIE